MQSFITSTRGALNVAITAGAVVLTLASAAVATTQPAEAFVRHGSHLHHSGRFGQHGRGFHGHRFAYGQGRRIGGFGLRHRIIGYRPDGFAARRFAYGVEFPYGGYGYGFRRCPIRRHAVPGLWCRPNVVYGYRTLGFRPVAYGIRQVIHPVGFHRGHDGGSGLHRYGLDRRFGGSHRGFRPIGFHHGGHVRHH